jgi:hypothetical protein
MLTDSLMIVFAATSAIVMNAAPVADLLGLKVTTALAAGLAAWSWLSAGNIALTPHEQRPVIAMRQPDPLSTKWTLRIPEDNQ